MKKYELRFYRNYYSKFEIIIEANSEEEAMKKFENDEYKSSDVTEPGSIQGGDDEFEEIACISDYCEKEKNNV